MTKPIIRVEGLSKRYRIGKRQEPYGTLREAATRAARAPFGRIREVYQNALHSLRTKHQARTTKHSSDSSSLSTVNEQLNSSFVVPRSSLGPSTQYDEQITTFHANVLLQSNQRLRKQVVRELTNGKPIRAAGERGRTSFAQRTDRTMGRPQQRFDSAVGDIR